MLHPQPDRAAERAAQGITPSGPAASSSGLGIDRAWDEFVARTPGATLHQTSLMGAFREATEGYRILRHTLRSNGSHGQGNIVGGAQVLIKRLPLGLGIGLIPRGPLLAPDQAHRAPELLDGLARICREAGVDLILVQPAPELVDTCDLKTHGLEPICCHMLPTASAVVDLGRNPDTLLASMRKSTRRNIRQGLKQGLTFRKGDFEDLPRFHELLMATGRRQSFRPASLKYFQTMWRHLEPSGHIHLFLTEHEGEALSGQLVHTFAGVAACKRIGWDGRGSHLHPNKVLDYMTMLWAQKQGLHTYDLEDIDPVDARKVLDAAPGSSTKVSPMSIYKLGLGSRVRLLPGPLVMPPRTLRGRACRAVLPVIQDSKAMRLARRVFLGRGYY